jgi:Ca2+-binding EF-hand superfamily protein
VDLVAKKTGLVVQKQGINFRSFVRIARRTRKEVRVFRQANNGFSPLEVEDLKKVFRLYDKDGNGDVGRQELIELLEDVIPSMVHNPKMRPKFIAMIHDADSDGSGTLDFADFLRLMRGVYEYQDEEKLAKQEQAIKATGFTPSEVIGFRDLFIAHSDETSHLSLSEVKKMIISITRLGDRLIVELADHFRAVVTTDPEGIELGQADFAEFLHLMQRLMEYDFAQIKEKTGFGGKEKPAG